MYVITVAKFYLVCIIGNPKLTKIKRMMLLRGVRKGSKILVLECDYVQNLLVPKTNETVVLCVIS